jgi:hypothetical protein
MDPQEQHVGRLRIGEYLVSDPAIGVEVSAGERQQRCDGQAFLTRNSQVGGVIRYVLTHWRLTFRRFRAVG